MSTDPGPGEQLVDAVRRRDRTALAALFAPDVDFVGLTPGRSWTASTPEEVVAVLLDHWFEESDVIAAAAVETGRPVSDTERFSYRFELDNDDGPHVVEQQAYYRSAGGRLSHVRILCSGFRPRT